jgi:hypothetical protein
LEQNLRRTVVPAVDWWREVRAMLYLKYAAGALGALLWSSGLIGQLHDLALTVKYLGISALMLVLALI